MDEFECLSDNLKDCTVNWLHFSRGREQFAERRLIQKVLMQRHRCASVILTGQRSSRLPFCLHKIQHRRRKNRRFFVFMEFCCVCGRLDWLQEVLKTKQNEIIRLANLLPACKELHTTQVAQNTTHTIKNWPRPELFHIYLFIFLFL